MKKHSNKSLSRPFLRRQHKLLDAIGQAKKDDQVQILSNLSDKSLKDVCKCMDEFLWDKGVFRKKLPAEEAEKLKTMIKPYSKHLKKFCHSNTKHSSRLRLMKKRPQEGGFLATLGTIVAGLVPIVSTLISNAIKK